MEVCAKIYVDKARYQPFLLTDIILTSLRDYTFDHSIVVDFMRILMGRNQLSDNRVSVSVAKLIEEMNLLEAVTPEITNRVAEFLAKAISKDVVALQCVADNTKDGQHSPLLLIVLQKIDKIGGEKLLLRLCRSNRIDLMASLHQRDQSIERLTDILTERNLQALLPLVESKYSPADKTKLIRSAATQSKPVRNDTPLKVTRLVSIRNIAPKTDMLEIFYEPKIISETIPEADEKSSSKSKRLAKNSNQDTEKIQEKSSSRARHKKTSDKIDRATAPISPWNSSQLLNNSQLDILKAIRMTSKLSSAKSKKIKVHSDFYAREVVEKLKLEEQLKALVETFEKNGDLFTDHSKLRTRIELMLNQIDLKNEFIGKMEIAES